MSLATVQQRIDAVCRDLGRATRDVTLIAVSKQQPENRIADALALGQRVFGENRVQEAQDRWQTRKASIPNLKLHLIGHLQTNKTADAVALFDVIQTLDSARLADALARESEKQARTIDCFIQINTGNETQKNGIAPQDLSALLRHSRDAGLSVRGLMCIPPAHDIPDMHFALLHKLAATHALPFLSMGMSSDFETALAYGATHLRIGSAFFGARQQ